MNPYREATGSTSSTSRVAGGKVGFDEIQFDYVRFPTDGDLSSAKLRRQEARGTGSDDRPLPPVRGQAAAPARRPRLGRPVRPRCDARPRRRPGTAAPRAVCRRGLPDGLPLALQPRGVPPRRSERSAGPDGRRRAARLQARASRAQGAARPVAAGLLARRGRTASPRCSSRSRRPAAPAPPASCSGTPQGVYTMDVFKNG